MAEPSGCKSLMMKLRERKAFSAIGQRKFPLAATQCRTLAAN
jgi:hypothetical protein